MRTWVLETTLDPVPGGSVLTAKGRIGRVTAAGFAEALRAARSDNPRLVLDLRAVDYISGPGLTALHEAADAAGALVLCGVNEAVRNTLELAGLVERVRIEESRQAAIEKIGRP
jgi:anti-anti-sigma factor